MNEIDPKLLPVPLEYTYPIIMECYMYKNSKDKSKGLEKKYYFPETGSWLNRRKRVLEYLKIRNIKYTNWICRWYLHLSEELIGTEYWADKMIEIFYSDKLEDTKRVIKEELLKDSDYVCDFLMTSKDFINLYYKTRRENNIPILKYDFSKLPDRIPDTKTRLEIPLLEINPKTGKPRGEYHTNYGYFISMNRDASLIPLPKEIDEFKERFIELAKSIHGDKYRYDQDLVYVDSRTPVKIFCNNCQEYFWQTPQSHLQGHGCPVCGNIKETKFDWEEEKDSIFKLIFEDRKSLGEIGGLYGVSGHQMGVIFRKLGFGVLQERLDDRERNTLNAFLSEGKTIEEIAEIRCVTPQAISFKIKRLNINYDFPSKSFGEICIEDFLKRNNIEYKDYKRYYNIEGRNSNYIIVDFWVKYKDREYVIEYNGKQHYKYIEYFHKSPEGLEKQIKRDQNEREYFSKEDVKECLIEIPYTISTRSEIWNLLENAIFNNIFYKIDYEKLYN